MAYFVRSILFEIWNEAELRRATDEKSKKKQNDKIDSAIVWAGRFADSYCRNKYSPYSDDQVFENLPTELIQPIGVIAVHRLINAGGTVPDRLIEDRKSAIAYLKDVSRGLIALNVASGEGDNTQSAATNKTADDSWADIDDMGMM